MEYNSKFIKYGHIEELITPKEVFRTFADRNPVFFEKIDGGNCQIRKPKDKLLFGSKANYLTGRIVNRTKWFSKFLNWGYSNASLYNLPENITLFGEWSGNHTIDYKSNNDKFFVIDVKDNKANRLLTYNVGKELLNRLDIKDLIFLKGKKLKKLSPGSISDLLDKQSDFYEGPKEGLVVKDYSKKPQITYKLLNPFFSEQRERRFRKRDPFTSARFRKNILAGIEEIGPDMPLNDLYERVRRDILNETGNKYPIPYIKKKMQKYLEDSFRKE